MRHRLALQPVAGHQHVRAGQILRVIEPHGVGAGSAGLRDLAANARVGDLVLELVDAARPTIVRAHAYLTGPAVQLHRLPDGTDHEVAYYEPARVERMSKLERFIEELGAEAPQDRIDELEELAIDELQRVRHAELDLALLDLEPGDAYRKAALTINAWWHLELDENEHLGRLEQEPTPPSLRSCNLIARVARHRRVQRATFRRHPSGAVYLHGQPMRHAGFPSASSFHIDALLEATLAS